MSEPICKLYRLFDKQMRMALQVTAAVILCPLFIFIQNSPNPTSISLTFLIFFFLLMGVNEEFMVCEDYFIFKRYWIFNIPIYTGIFHYKDIVAVKHPTSIKNEVYRRPGTSCYIQFKALRRNKEIDIYIPVFNTPFRAEREKMETCFFRQIALKANLPPDDDFYTKIY